MAGQIYIRDEFLAKVGIHDDILETWEKARLIAPVGYTEDKVPFYSESAIGQVEKISKLTDLGYSLEEIQKIVKRVGLPKTEHKQSDKAMDHYLTVGGLADKVGVSPRTLKHWETIGIIEPDMRSEGGFRLYSEVYIFLSHLVQDLQRFGYSLEDIKQVSDYFREFLQIQSDPELLGRAETGQKLDDMLEAIDKLFGQMNLLKEGIQRWEDLLKKKRKEVQNLKNRNRKQSEGAKNA
ncbi:MerR family transcriptional regulator [bacterium]|nr:MerR family transcriptional regulator [bacterium]